MSLTNTLRRREIPFLIMLITGLVTLTDYFFPIEFIGNLTSTFQNWTIIAGNCALFIGMISISIAMYRKIKRREPGQWQFAIWALIVLYGTILLGVTQGMLSPLYLEYYQATKVSLYCAMTGLLLFFICSACYRAFIVKNVDATIIMGVAVILWICNAPFGQLIWDKAPEFANWINFYLNMGASRGYNIGIATGGIALGIRTLLGKERGAISLGED